MNILSPKSSELSKVLGYLETTRQLIARLENLPPQRSFSYHYIWDRLECGTVGCVAGHLAHMRLEQEQSRPTGGLGVCSVHDRITTLFPSFLEKELGIGLPRENPLFYEYYTGLALGATEVNNTTLESYSAVGLTLAADIVAARLNAGSSGLEEALAALRVVEKYHVDHLERISV